MPKIIWSVTKSGVYCIKCLVNNKVYIGSTVKSIRGRINSHYNMLRAGNHHSIHLQRAWNKYGESQFESFVLLNCSPKDCIKYEQEYIDSYKAANPKFGFNRRPKAESNRGMTWSEKTIQLMSLSKKGLPKSEDHKRKISEANKGKKKSPEHTAKMAQSKTGSRHTPEAKARISAGLRKRWEDKEFRNKVVKGLTGLKRTQETCDKIGAIHQGRKMSEESKAKMRIIKKQHFTEGRCPKRDPLTGKYLETGSEVGLHRVEKLFTELQ